MEIFLKFFRFAPRREHPPVEIIRNMVNANGEKASEENFHEVMPEGEFAGSESAFELMNRAPLADLLFCGVMKSGVILLSAPACRFDFDEHECFSVAHEQIDFRAAESEVVFDQFISEGEFEEASRQPLSLSPQPDMRRRILFHLQSSSTVVEMPWL